MTANHPEDLAARPPLAVLMSASGMPYNGEWIDYWEKRALAAESTIRNRDETIAALRNALERIIELDTQHWRVDHADMVPNKVRIDTRDGPYGTVARRALASPHQEGTGT